MAIHKGTILLLLSMMISLASSSPVQRLGRSLEHAKDIKSYIDEALKNCPEGCSTTGMDRKCQCLQIPITSVGTCTADYFKQGLESLQSVHRIAGLLKKRLGIHWSKGFQLALHCEPVVSPKMFLQQLKQVFEFINTSALHPTDQL